MRAGKPVSEFLSRKVHEHVSPIRGALSEWRRGWQYPFLADAKDKITAYLQDYNESRPHRALNNLTHLEYVAQLENGA